MRRHGRSLRFSVSVFSYRGFVQALCRVARLSQGTVRADGSGRERVSGRLVFGMVEEAWCFVRNPAGLVWRDASDKLDVYQEPGTW